MKEEPDKVKLRRSIFYTENSTGKGLQARETMSIQADSRELGESRKK